MNFTIFYYDPSNFMIFFRWSYEEFLIASPIPDSSIFSFYWLTNFAAFLMINWQKLWIFFPIAVRWILFFVLCNQLKNFAIISHNWLMNFEIFSQIDLWILQSLQINKWKILWFFSMIDWWILQFLSWLNLKFGWK